MATIFRGIYRGVRITQEGSKTRLTHLVGPWVGQAETVDMRGGQVMALDMVRAIIDQRWQGRPPRSPGMELRCDPTFVDAAEQWRVMDEQRRSHEVSGDGL